MTPLSSPSSHDLPFWGISKNPFLLEDSCTKATLRAVGPGKREPILEPETLLSNIFRVYDFQHQR
jgi:hypothetical protein